MATKDTFDIEFKYFPSVFCIWALLMDVTNRLTICDELYEPNGGHHPHGQNQTIFGLVIEP